MSSSRATLVFFAALLCMEFCYSASIPRNYDPRLTDDVIVQPKKRPFCNAFTGCGRKRSLNPPGMPLQEYTRPKQFLDEDTLNSLLDSENTVDELSHQILSEAKLWEAIQDASAEIARRKQREMMFNN